MMTELVKALGYRQVLAGILAVFVGFASSFAIVLSGLQSMGATPDQAATGLGVLMIAAGLCNIFLAWRLRIPAALAWSTPGAAFLATIAMPEGGFAEACGAFMLSSVAIVLTGWIKPLRQWVERIPLSLSSAMLAGVLINICLIPVTSLVEAPSVIGPVVLVWFLVSLFSSLWAVPAAVVAALMVMGVAGDWPIWQAQALAVEWIWPTISLSSAVGIALPLYLITMTSQNLAGAAVLRSYGYQPPLSKVLSTTGLASMLIAPLGGHHINLASITSAMSANPDVGPFETRYGSVIAGGVMFILMGLACASLIPYAYAAPANLVPSIAGLALIGATANSLKQAFASDQGQNAAAICFVVTAAGVSVLGIGSAFWGLLAGLMVHRLEP